jgi:PKHD-type hydroxylase
MIFTLQDVLTETQLAAIEQDLAGAEFKDGKLTAGWHAQSVKHNLQISSQDQVLGRWQGSIAEALSQHRLFQAIARPKLVRPVLINRYDAGMSYGYHTDNALMPHPQGTLRSDISITIFLNSPQAYDGGELVVETSLGEQGFKLAAGSALVYPSSTLHCVTEVTRGTRLAAVTWVQSWVRDPAQREILFDLDTARQVMFEQQGKTPQFDLISKSLSNLLRAWAD